MKLKNGKNIYKKNKILLRIKMTDKVVRLTKKGLPDKRSLTSKENISKGRILVKGALKETFSRKDLDSSDDDTDSETESEVSVEVSKPPPIKKEVKPRVKKVKEEEKVDFEKKLKEREDSLVADYEKKLKLKEEEVLLARKGVIGGLRTKMSCRF
jgi:hypothetical protein